MKYRLLFAVAAASLFYSCDNAASDSNTATVVSNKTEELKAEDLVHNPNTANAQEIKTEGKAPKLEFKKSEYDFGTIKSGEVVTHVYEFTNTGDSPLIIDNASASCGCTVPEYPREPIAPGQSGKITVKFDSKGKFGQQSKQVTIRANTQPNITTLTIKGNIQGTLDTSMGPTRQ